VVAGALPGLWTEGGVSHWAREVAAQWFHAEDWIDFSIRQNSHQAKYTGRYDWTLEDYGRPPASGLLALPCSHRPCRLHPGVVPEVIPWKSAFLGVIRMR